MADAFLTGKKISTALDYTRRPGDLVRFDPATEEFGVLDANGIVRTYFKPVPGVTHKRPTRLEYFRITCLRFNMHLGPVCGYDELPFAPADYHICACCGVEFGADDMDFTHDELRTRWIRNGMPWFSTTTHPPRHWNPGQQLINAGFALV